MTTLTHPYRRTVTVRKPMSIWKGFWLTFETRTFCMRKTSNTDFYSKTNQTHQCLKFILFHFGVTLNMFRTVFPSIIRSSRLYIQQPNRYCCLLVSKQSEVSLWHMPIAVCTVFNSWWWTERSSETCRASFQNKINFIGFTIEVILRCTALWTLKVSIN